MLGLHKKGKFNRDLFIRVFKFEIHINAQKSSQSASKTFITAFPTEKRWPFENMLPVIEHSFNNEENVRFSGHL